MNLTEGDLLSPLRQPATNRIQASINFNDFTLSDLPSHTTTITTMASIVVEPPSTVTTGTQMYPPVVARIRISGIQDGGAYVYGQAILLDGAGNVLANQLGGTVVVTPTVLADSSSRRGGSSSRNNSPTSLYFAFLDLSIAWPGVYSIRIDIHMLDYNDAQGSRYLASAETQTITALDESVAVGRPCEYPASFSPFQIRKANRFSSSIRTRHYPSPSRCWRSHSQLINYPISISRFPGLAIEARRQLLEGLLLVLNSL